MNGKETEQSEAHIAREKEQLSDEKVPLVDADPVEDEETKGRVSPGAQV